MGSKEILQKTGIDVDLMGSLTCSMAFQSIKKRLLNIQSQLSAVSQVCSPLSWNIYTKAGTIPSYLTWLTYPHERRAFTLARCNSFPSAVFPGIYSGTSYHKRLCNCKQGTVESLIHMVYDARIIKQYVPTACPLFWVNVLALLFAEKSVFIRSIYNQNCRGFLKTGWSDMVVLLE